VDLVQAGGEKKKLSKAKALFRESNFNGVLNTLEPLFKKWPNNPVVNYYGGRAYFELKYYQDAFEHIRSLVQSDPKKFKDTYFWYGRCWQQLHEPDSALYWLNFYKKSLNRFAVDRDEVDYHIRSAENFKKYRAQPLNVQFYKLGSEINTEYEEACPSINAEGTLLFFTSRRPSTTGGQRDPWDLKYFQDIYVSVRDTLNNKWQEAVPLKNVNTVEHDANMNISPDGKVLFIYKNIKGKTGSGDIWISREKNGEWSRARDFQGQFNSSYFETSASLSPDGRILYFISERPEGKALGNGDIWYCERISNKEWGKCNNLGDVVNTPYDEISVWAHPDGQTLFFASKGHDSMGGYDIFKTEKKNGKWTTPLNLGYPINTPDDEIHFTVTADGKRAYLASRREIDENELNIYELDLTNYVLINRQGGEKNPDKGLVRGGNILSIMKGQILGAGASVTGEIIFMDEKSGKEVLRIETDEEGWYFATLEGGRRYKVIVSSVGFKSIEESIYLSKKDGPQPFTLQRNFSLIK